MKPQLNFLSIFLARRIAVAFVMLIQTIIMTPAAAQALSSPGQELRTVAIATKGGTRTFQVELADTRETRARGLMFRTKLPERNGMLFDFGRDQEIRMWMKDTLIPLDMVFIESDGRIRRIEENAAPESHRVISSGGPARAVLELNAGSAKKFGFVPGDRVVGSSFVR